ncbi:MAG TPA: MEDS domain-containing protein [Propionibacteriaceae bacterium]|nr:MEDS domain-containing protein [Propionibacteriaceae bacterium]
MTVDTRRRTGSATSVVLAGRPEERIIITLAPARWQQSYRHEAFLWHDASDFTAGIVPFIRDGLEAGEPVMVAVSALHMKWLWDALDGQADVEFVDMEELGRNPSQIIPAWQQFLNTRSGRFRPVRGIGEPIWPGRRPEELVECQLPAEVTVQMWSQPHALICEVVDDTVIDDLLLGRRVPVEDEHDGLLARQPALRSSADALVINGDHRPGPCLEMNAGASTHSVVAEQWVCACLRPQKPIWEPDQPTQTPPHQTSALLWWQTQA